MSRYDASTGVEGEYEPGSRRTVLRNLLGIKSKVQMDVEENERLIAVQEQYYDSPDITEDTQFTADILCKDARRLVGRPI